MGLLILNSEGGICCLMFISLSWIRSWEKNWSFDCFRIWFFVFSFRILISLRISVCFCGWEFWYCVLYVYGNVGFVRRFMLCLIKLWKFSWKAWNFCCFDLSNLMFNSIVLTRLYYDWNDTIFYGQLLNLWSRISNFETRIITIRLWVDGLGYESYYCFSIFVWLYGWWTVILCFLMQVLGH